MSVLLGVFVKHVLNLPSRCLIEGRSKCVASARGMQLCSHYFLLLFSSRKKIESSSALSSVSLLKEVISV